MSARQALRAAERCCLSIAACKTTMSLYGYVQPRLDEVGTLRRVALLLRGSGRAPLTQPERDAALSVIRERFDEHIERIGL